MNYKNIIVIILFLSLFQSCAFVGVGAIGTANFTSLDMRHFPTIYRMPKKDLSVEKHTWKEGQFKKNDVQMEWGVPDKITVINENSESWTYKKGLRCKGIIILAIIPVPFALPVGRTSIKFTFENNLLSYFSIIDDHWCLSYAGVNFIPLDPGGSMELGFASGTVCKWHKVNISVYGTVVCDLPYYGCYPPGSEY